MRFTVPIEAIKEHGTLISRRGWQRAKLKTKVLKKDYTVNGAPLVANRNDVLEIFKKYGLTPRSNDLYDLLGQLRDHLSSL